MIKDSLSPEMPAKLDALYDFIATHVQQWPHQTPTERELGARFGVKQSEIRRRLALLVKQGKLTKMDNGKHVPVLPAIYKETFLENIASVSRFIPPTEFQKNYPDGIKILVGTEKSKNTRKQQI